MQVFYKVLEKVISLFILGATGYIAGKYLLVPRQTGVYLSAVVVKITAPLLVFLTMVNRKFELDILRSGIKIFIFGLIFISMAYLISLLVCQFTNISPQRVNLLKMHIMFGNTIYMAFPVFIAILGREKLIYCIFYNMAQDIVLWTFGIYLLNAHSGANIKDNLRKMINTNTISFAAGFVVMFLSFFLGEISVSLPILSYPFALIGGTLTDLGNTTMVLSMVFIGLILSEVEFGGIKGLITRKLELIYSFIKLLLIPAIAIGVFYLIGSHVEPIVKKIVVLQLAMPSATIISALAAEYKNDYTFASQCVFYSTILSLLTLPIINMMIPN